MSCALSFSRKVLSILFLLSMLGLIFRGRVNVRRFYNFTRTTYLKSEDNFWKKLRNDHFCTGLQSTPPPPPLLCDSSRRTSDIGHQIGHWRGHWTSDTGHRTISVFQHHFLFLFSCNLRLSKFVIQLSYARRRVWSNVQCPMSGVQCPMPGV